MNGNQNERNGIMQKIGEALVAIAISVAALGSATVGAQASTAAGQAGATVIEQFGAANPADSAHGCPSGDVCMYTQQGFIDDQPEHEYRHYGCYNLSGEFGSRAIVNNQVDNATVTLYQNSGCTNPSGTPLPAGQSEGVLITPINSLSLQP
jgi:hypothetical protein